MFTLVFFDLEVFAIVSDKLCFWGKLRRSLG